MRQDNHVYAVSASSSIIGPIIPPSMIIVIYGAVTSVSIGALFVAAIYRAS